jgi:predicted DNA-binding transcriptional regulator AlpA
VPPILEGVPFPLVPCSSRGGCLRQGSSDPIQPVARLSDELTVFDELLDAREVAALLKVRYKRVYDLGIPTVRVGPRTLRWRVSDIEAWLSARRDAA